MMFWGRWGKDVQDQVRQGPGDVVVGRRTYLFFSQSLGTRTVTSACLGMQSQVEMDKVVIGTVCMCS